MKNNIIKLNVVCNECEDGMLYARTTTIDDAMYHGTDKEIGKCEDCNDGYNEKEYTILDIDNLLNEDLLSEICECEEDLQGDLIDFIKENNLENAIKQNHENEYLLREYKLFNVLNYLYSLDEYLLDNDNYLYSLEDDEYPVY